MDVWVRLALGLAGLAVFASLTLDDARALHTRSGVPVRWTLAATGATVVAGLVHLALTPEHWEESSVYGAFFLLSGLVQLLLASVLTRPASSAWTWYATIAVNLVLVAVYALTRLVPPLGADLPEAVDAIGVATVVAELAAATLAYLITYRHRLWSAAPRPRTEPSCPDPRARDDGSGTRTGP